jgi:hypothetical protein
MPIWPLYALGLAVYTYAFNKVDDNVIDPITGGANSSPRSIGVNRATIGVLLVGAAGAGLYLKGRR